MNTIEHYWKLMNTSEHYWTLWNTIEDYWWSLGTLKSDYIMHGPPLTLIIMERFLWRAKSLVLNMHQPFRRPQVLSFSHWWWLLSWNGGLQGWRLWGSSPPNYIQGKAPALFVPPPNSPLLPLKTHLKRLNAAPGLVLCAKDTVELNSKQNLIFLINLLWLRLISYQGMYLKYV